MTKQKQEAHLKAARDSLLQCVKTNGVMMARKIMWIKGNEMLLYSEGLNDKVTYVYDAPSGLQNDDLFKGLLYPAGSYSGPRYKGTIPAYATSPEKAVEYMNKQ